MTYVKYASLLLQQMTVEVDEDFLFALLDFGKFSGATGVAEPPSCVLLFRPLANAKKLTAGVGVCSRSLKASLSPRSGLVEAISISRSCIFNLSSSISRS